MPMPLNGFPKKDFLFREFPKDSVNGLAMCRPMSTVDERFRVTENEGIAPLVLALDGSSELGRIDDEVSTVLRSDFLIFGESL